MLLNLRRIWKYFCIFIEILFQKWRCWNLGNIDSLVADSIAGKTVMITGPTSGIGKAASWALAKKGAHVVLACRNEVRGEELKQEFLKQGAKLKLPDLHLEVVKLDVSDLVAVKQFAFQWRSQNRPIDVLINNAGIFDIGRPRKADSNGMELHLLTNYLGPFLLTLGLLPCLQKHASEGKDCRIVNVASTMHELTDMDLTDPFMSQPGSFSSDRAYAQSKLAMIAFTSELQKRLKWDEGITVCSVHPGEAITEVARGIPAILKWIYKTWLDWILFTAEEGARSVVYCGTMPQVILQSRQHGGYFGSSCTPERPSKASQDRSFAKSLWDWSVGIVDLSNDWNLREEFQN